MQKVVAFDFDGTLVKGESFFPYIYSYGELRFLKAIPELIQYPLRQDRLRLKEALLTAAFQGKGYEELLEHGELFFKKWIIPRLRPELLKKLERHKKEEDFLVLVSANIPPLLKAVERELEFDALLCSEIELDKEGKVTGKLSTPNCVGDEKVHRIKSFFGEEPFFLEAYGNSAGDRPLLLHADLPHWV